jgi:hypothetical protein
VVDDRVHRLERSGRPPLSPAKLLRGVIRDRGEDVLSDLLVAQLVMASLQGAESS